MRDYIIGLFEMRPTLTVVITIPWAEVLDCIIRRKKSTHHSVQLAADEMWPLPPEPAATLPLPCPSAAK